MVGVPLSGLPAFGVSTPTTPIAVATAVDVEIDAAMDAVAAAAVAADDGVNHVPATTSPVSHVRSSVGMSRAASRQATPFWPPAVAGGWSPWSSSSPSPSLDPTSTPSPSLLPSPLPLPSPASEPRTTGVPVASIPKLEEEGPQRWQHLRRALRGPKEGAVDVRDVGDMVAAASKNASGRGDGGGGGVELRPSAAPVAVGARGAHRTPAARG
ncbi:hypothetical protein MMPV_009711 [Pyropia vietnamensis]